jgi:1-acyl-sn-glycerol-3-phosphate acyltransferase
MKKLANSLYSLYAFAAFGFFVPFMVVYYLIIAYFPGKTEKQKTLALFQGNSRFLSVWEKMVGIKQLAEGRELIDENKTYVFICNHVNMLDITLMGRYFTHYAKVLAKKETQNIPLLGILFRHIAIFVDRSSAESRKKSIESMQEVLASGCSILMAPEGTRNRTAEPLAPFHSGAFRLAIAAQVPIFPLVFLDLKEAQPVTTFQVKPATIRVRYLPPISTKGMTENEVELLKEMVIKRMLEVLYAEDSYWKKRKTEV